MAPDWALASSWAPVSWESCAQANGAAANGSGLLKRFGKKEEPQDVPVAPSTKVVRRQPVRQTRSKRGNTGKR